VRTLAIINQKGGCGKTTTAINVAGVLARLGNRTLLVDLDPQAHCAAGLGIPDDSVEFDIGQAMLTPNDRRLDPTRLLWRVATNLDLAPSTMRLAGLEAARGGLADLEDRDARLAATLGRLAGRFDWVVIDCPPSIGLLTYNALRAATEALIPVETSFFAMKGAQRQVRTIKALARRLGGQTPYRVAATMHDPDNPLAGELLTDLQQTFGDLLIPHVIRLDRTLREATTFGRPIIDYKPRSPGAADYADLTRWLLANPPARRSSRVGVAAELATESRGATQSIDDFWTDPEGVPELPEVEDVAPGATNSPRPSEDEAGAGDPPAPIASPDRVIEQKAETEVRETASRAADLAARIRRLLDRSPADALHEQADRTPVPPASDAPTPLRSASPTRERSGGLRAGVARLFGARETSTGVLFVHPAPARADVRVSGDFNAWAAEGRPLRYNPETSAHEGIVQIPPGRCEYRLIIDGRWTPDPYNPTRTSNPFGGENSVVVVTQAGRSGPVTEGAD